MYFRKALKKKINFDELDAEKYGNAIRSKPIILKAITDINAGNIVKTKLILISLTYKNVSLRGYPEKFANQEFYPLKNYHKEWYDFEADSVMICP
jgi:hypothetical protein